MCFVWRWYEKWPHSLSSRHFLPSRYECIICEVVLYIKFYCDQVDFENNMLSNRQYFIIIWKIRNNIFTDWHIPAITTSLVFGDKSANDWLFWCFAFDISTELAFLYPKSTHSTLWLACSTFLFKVLNLIVTTSSFFGLLERWRASIPVQLRDIPGKQGTVPKYLQWKTSSTGYLSLQNLSFITILDSSPHYWTFLEDRN